MSPFVTKYSLKLWFFVYQNYILKKQLRQKLYVFQFPAVEIYLFCGKHWELLIGVVFTDSQIFQI